MKALLSTALLCAAIGSSALFSSGDLVAQTSGRLVRLGSSTLSLSCNPNGRLSIRVSNPTNLAVTWRAIRVNASGSVEGRPGSHAERTLNPMANEEFNIEWQRVHGTGPCSLDLVTSQSWTDPVRGPVTVQATLAIPVRCSATTLHVHSRASCPRRELPVWVKNWSDVNVSANIGVLFDGNGCLDEVTPVSKLVQLGPREEKRVTFTVKCGITQLNVHSKIIFSLVGPPACVSIVKVGCNLSRPISERGKRMIGDAVWEYDLPFGHWFDLEFAGHRHAAGSRSYDLVAVPKMTMAVAAGRSLGKLVRADRIFLRSDEEDTRGAYWATTAPERRPGKVLFEHRFEHGWIRYSRFDGTVDRTGQWWQMNGRVEGTFAAFGGSETPFKGSYRGVVVPAVDDPVLMQIGASPPGGEASLVLTGAPRARNLAVLVASAGTTRLPIDGLGTVFLDPSSSAVVGAYTINGQSAWVDVPMPTAGATYGDVAYLQAVFTWDAMPNRQVTKLSNGITLRLR